MLAAKVSTDNSAEHHGHTFVFALGISNLSGQVVLLIENVVAYADEVCPLKIGVKIYLDYAIRNSLLELDYQYISNVLSGDSTY